MSRKSILIVGGTGFIGSKLTGRLVKEGQKVVCFDIKPDAVGIRDPDVKFIQGDMTHIEELIAAIDEHKINCIAALAYMLSPVCEEYPHRAVRINALGANNIFEAARLTGVRRIVFTSSFGVYGPQFQYVQHGEKLLGEDDVARPVGVYQALKQLSEVMAQKYNSKYGMDILAVRPASILGHGRKPINHWCGTIVSEPTVGKPVYVNYPSSSKICPVYVDDIVDLIALLCLTENARYQIYNAPGHITTLAKLADTVREYIPDAQISFNDEGKLYQELHVAYNIDNARAIAEFGWQPRSLKEAVLAHINEARAEAGLASVIP